MAEENTKTFYHDCGKGDRPRGTGWKNYYSNWDAIFGKKEDESAKEESGCSNVVDEPKDAVEG